MEKGFKIHNAHPTRFRETGAGRIWLSVIENELVKCIVDQFLNPPLRPRLSLRGICVNRDGAGHRIAVLVGAQRRGFQHESVLGSVCAIALLRDLDRTRLALLSGDFNLGRNGSEQKAMPGGAFLILSACTRAIPGLSRSSIHSGNGAKS